MEIHLSKWQTTVWDDSHRFRVVCSGRRSGKSTFAQLTVITWASTNPGLYWIVAPNYKMAKEIHWKGIQEYLPKALISKKNEVELSITLKNGSVIQLKGAENPDTLRGVKLRGLVIDEIASLRNWSWLWEEVLRPTLTDYIAPVIFISTPQGYNHFWDIYLKGQETTGDYKSWKFTSYDNPYIPAEEIDKAKAELSEDTFAQEYLADFRKTTGLAFKLWNREIHLIKPFEVPATWQRARGFDYGSSDPTASVRVAIDNEDNWFVEKCYKDKKKTIEEHANAILAQDYGLSFIPIYGDPSGDQWEKEFAQRNIHIQPANKMIGQGTRGWVEYGVEVINQRLKENPGHEILLSDGRFIHNAPKLFVLDTTENQQLVREMELLRWKETNVGQTLPILDESVDREGHSDLCAALRYLAVSFVRNPDSQKDLRIYGTDYRDVNKGLAEKWGI